MVDAERVEIPAMKWSIKPGSDTSEYITYYMENLDEVWLSAFDQILALEEGLLMDAIIKALRTKGYTVTRNE